MRFAGTLFVLIVVFLISVFARIGLVNNVVSNYDHCDFFLLTTYENWNERGIKDCHFTPVLTYNNPGDKHVAYYKRLESKEGDNYFVSFPPFAFLFPYTIFKVLHVVPGKLAIQVFNMFLHFVSAFFIYLLLFRHYIKNDPLRLHLPSLVAFTVYLFIPILLYAHAVVYFPETLGQVFWIIALYLSMRWVDAGVEAKRKTAYLLATVVFFMIYTEWIGIFYVIILLIAVQRSKVIELADKLFLMKSVFISAASAIVLTFVQYSSIDGVVSLLKAFVIRYAERSGMMDTTHSDLGFNYFTPGSYMRLAANLHSVLFPFGYLLIVMAIIIGFNKGFNYLLDAAKRNKILLSLATIPGIIHLFVFFNSSVIHSHCAAVLAPGIAVLFGLVYGWLLDNFGRTVKSILMQSAVVVIAIFFSKQYFDRSHQPHPDHSFLTQAANTIKQDAQKDEVIFLNIKTDLGNPLQYISFMSKRNMLYANDSVEVKQAFATLNKSKAVFYQFEAADQKPLVSRFAIH